MFVEVRRIELRSESVRENASTTHSPDLNLGEAYKPGLNRTHQSLQFESGGKAAARSDLQDIPPTLAL